MNLDALTTEDFGEIATMFASREQWEKARPWYQELATRMDGSPDARAYLALAWLKTGEPLAAEMILSRLLLEHPCHPFANNVMALVKQENADWVGAEESYQRAIELNPTNPGFRSGYAYLLQILERYPESEAQYDAAVATNPTNLQARFFRALTILTQGRFREGIQDYELRYALSPSPVPLTGRAIWRGEESLVGKTVLLSCYEQGLGDAIQFIRYAAWLHEIGAREVIALVKPELELLIAHVPGVDSIVTKPEDAGNYDFAVPAMSCMGLSLSQDGQPWYGPTPYIYDLGQFSRLLPPDKLKVGFCWFGNPAHGNDRFRSLPSGAFAKLLLPEICCVNLQHNIEYPSPMLNPRIDSVLELAKLIGEMDLVITCDTAIAHLSGALGVATWILLPSNPDFRWGLDRSDTPWYKSAVLWRAKAPLEWAPVIEEVQAALQNMLKVSLAIG